MTLKQTRKEKYAKLREEIAKENIENDITDFFTKHSDKVVSVHYRPVVSELVQKRKMNGQLRNIRRRNENKKTQEDI